MWPAEELAPLTDELGPTAPSVSPDGKWFYYLVDETEINSGRLTFKRRASDGSNPETILVVDTTLPGTKFRPSQIYPLSTISSDGRRFAAAAFLGDGNVPGVWGLLVFDINAATVNVVLTGQSWCNLHPQYSRSLDPAQAHDILVQENHGNRCGPSRPVHDLGGRGGGRHPCYPATTANISAICRGAATATSSARATSAGAAAATGP